MKLRKQIPLMITSKRQYLGVNLTKDQILYTANYKTLIEEIKENLERRLMFINLKT